MCSSSGTWSIFPSATPAFAPNCTCITRVRVVYFCQITCRCLHVFVTRCTTTRFAVILYSHCFLSLFGGISCFFNVICIHWCPTWCPCQMTFMSFNSNTTGITNEEGTVNPFRRPELIPGFVWGLCCSIFVDHWLSFVLHVLQWRRSDYAIYYLKTSLTISKC